ncbi:ester cyclase [Altericroceibacterium spongiae]|nr:ester cyclase [Altericroceibacterium spongiae]
MPHSPQEQHNLDFCTRMYKEMLFTFDASRVDEFIHPDYIQHSTAASEGREGLRAFFADRADRFPDVKMAIKGAFADGDYTIFQIHTIRHDGDPGMAIVDIFRMEEGRVREHWEVLQEIPAKLPHNNGIY